MITKTVTASDGVSRTVQGKIFGEQLRIYRVYGDVTNREALEEMAQILALETNTTNVLFTGV